MRDPHDLYHQKPKFWQTFPSLTNKQRYTLCIQSKLESQGGFERKRGREGRQKPPPVPRTTFLQIVGTFYVASVDIYSEIPTVPGRLPFASMTSRGSTVLPSPEPVFVSPVLFLLWPSWTRIRESTYPTSSTYRSLLYSLAWLSRLARFNRPCRVFNGYISRHFEMPDTGAQDILLADILSR